MGLMGPNPIPMRGRLEQCWLIVYRAPLASVQARLPKGLEAVEHGGFGFYHWVVGEVSGLRPAFLPRVLGLRYRHAALRVLCRTRLADGRMQAGLHFLRSDCQAPPGVPLARLGNWLTDFHFHDARIRIDTKGTRIELEIAGSCPASWTLDPVTPLRDRDQSPFRSVDEAVRCLKYPPCALSVDRSGAVHAVTITRDESHWLSRPVGVVGERCPAMAASGARLELACEVAPIDYLWNPGSRL